MNGVKRMGTDNENIPEAEQAQHAGKAQSALLEENIVINVVEVLAYEKISEIMSRMKVCNCQKCTADVLAIALNNLPAKYVTSDAGKQYIQLASYKMQFETDVVSALIKACLVVKESPKHE